MITDVQNRSAEWSWDGSFSSGMGYGERRGPERVEES